ncbi:MAG: hypothetical protein V2B19_33120 [Pseudomonadota bacterium]
MLLNSKLNNILIFPNELALAWFSTGLCPVDQFCLCNTARLPGLATDTARRCLHGNENIVKSQMAVIDTFLRTLTRMNCGTLSGE